MFILTLATMVVPLLILLLAIALGLPIAYSMAVSGVVGLIMAVGIDQTVSMMGTVPFAGSASFALTTIPLFVLMAEFLSHGTLTRQLFDLASKWLSSFRGGLAMSTVVANGIFGAMSGSSVAAAGLLARVSVPEMRRLGYSERLSLGVVAAAGTFAVMIPPSIALVIYGVTTETSIGRLFAAGIVPGVFTGVIYLGIVFLWARLVPNSVPPGERNSWSERIRHLKAALPAIPLIFLVLGGIYLGLMTPTEAGAVGALGALVVSVVFGGLRMDGIRRAVASAVTISSMVLLIIVAAEIFTTYLSVSRVLRTTTDFVVNAGFASWSFMALCVAVFLVLGTFMSEIAIMLLTLPLLFPIAMEFGFDPIWFGIVVVKTVEIGLATPPLGLNVYVTHGVAGGKLTDAFYGSGIFLLGDLVVLGTLLAFPAVVTLPADFILGTSR